MTPVPPPAGEIDDAVQRELERRGFALVRLLDPAVAAGLADSWHERARSGATGPAASSEPFSFHLRSDEPCGPDDELCAAVEAAIGPAIGGFVPFMWSVLVKWPGTAPLHLHPQAAHRDWMYVDETQGDVSYMVWLALDDVAAPSGGFRAVPGSHRVEVTPRGTGLDAPWLEDLEAWNARMVDVPVEAGVAIVFHPGLVHATWPNTTDRPRPVVSAGVCRPGDQLVHFQRTGPSSVAVHRLDRFDLASIAGRCADPGTAPTRHLTAHPSGTTELLQQLDRLLT